MSGKTGNDVQALWLTNLKSKTNITSLLANSSQIKEEQWQGTVFVYPAVRFSVDFFPAINRCLDRAEIVISVFSEEKSSDQASTIAGAIQTEYHGKPFKQGTTQFPVVVVTRVDAPMRSVYAWESKVHINARVA